MTLGLSDTITVSLLVLVVVGVAVIAQQRRRLAGRSLRHEHERDALLRFGHGEVGSGLEGVLTGGVGAQLGGV